MNYNVDLCSCKANLRKETLNKQYDIIFGFGPAFFEAARICPDARLILYLTENPYYISFQRENERLEYLYQRRKIKQKIERTGMFFKENDENKVDAIICLGEEKYVDSEDRIVKRIFPSGFLNNEFKPDFRKKKSTSFLILASMGFVHKGYDIVFEVAMKHPEWTIHYCGSGLPTQLKRIRMKKPENVIDHGFVDICSAYFLQIIEETTFIIQPSCSEASSTAILTAMRHGIIPITTKGNGLDELDRYIYFTDDYRLEAIETIMLEASRKPVEELKERAQQIYLYANKEFSISSFSENFAYCMNSIIDELKA